MLTLSRLSPSYNSSVANPASVDRYFHTGGVRHLMSAALHLERTEPTASCVAATNESGWISADTETRIFLPVRAPDSTARSMLLGQAQGEAENARLTLRSRGHKTPRAVWLTDLTGCAHAAEFCRTVARRKNYFRRDFFGYRARKYLILAGVHISATAISTNPARIEYLPKRKKSGSAAISPNHVN